MEADKYLTKTFKGRFIEHLEHFLFTLDKEYQWTNYHFSYKPTKNKTKFFFCFYCRTTESLILCMVHKIANAKETVVKIEYNENVLYSTYDRTFIVDAVYSKHTKIQQPDFESVAENFDFLFP